MNGTWRIRSEKLGKHHRVKGYARCLESKRVESDEGRNVEQMWEQVKRVMDDSTREVCSSVRVRRNNPKNVWGM